MVDGELNSRIDNLCTTVDDLFYIMRRHSFAHECKLRIIVHSISLGSYSKILPLSDGIIEDNRLPSFVRFYCIRVVKELLLAAVDSEQTGYEQICLFQDKLESLLHE